MATIENSYIFLILHLIFYIIHLFLKLIYPYFFESIPVLSANFFGAVFGLYFFIIPNLEYSEAKEELYVIRPFYFLPKKFSKLE